MASSPTSSPTFHTLTLAPPLQNNTYSSSSSSSLPKPGPHSIPPLPTYRPSHQSHSFLRWPDLHAQYSPPGSPQLSIPSVQRPLSNKDLRHRFQSQYQGQQKGQQATESRSGNQLRNQPLPGQNPPIISTSTPPTASSSSSRSSSHSSGSPSSQDTSIDQPIRQTTRLSAKLPDPPIFNGSKKNGFDE